MSDKVEYSRLLLKRSNTAGVTPTIPPVTATTLNQFTPTDLFVGEMFVNVEDDRAWVRTNNSIIEFNFTGGTSGSTVIPNLTQVLNSGNTTGGFDILFPSGSKPVYTGLASGGTSQYLGLDASGNTIIVTGATGGSGTSGSSGSSGRNGSSGINGTSGSSGTSGVSGLGLFLPLSGGTVTGNTTFTQNVYLTNLTSGGSSTYLTVDSDTGQLYTATGSTGGSGTSGSSGINGTSGSSGINGTSGSSGISGTSGSSGVDGTSGSSGVSGTSGSSGVNGTSGSSGVNGTSGSSGVNGTSGSSGISGTSGLSGVNGTSGSSGVSGTSGSSGVNGTSGTSFSGGSGNCITDLYVTNIHGCSPINVADDIIFSGDVFITNITSGGSSTYLTIDSDTGQLYTATGGGGSGTSGTNGSSGVNGTSGTSGTGGGGGSSLPGVHFNYPLVPGSQGLITLTGAYQAVAWGNWAMRTIAYPVIPAQNVSFSGISLDLYNAAAGGEMAFALYGDNQNKPGSLILSSTTISTASGFAIKQYNVNYTLSAGTRYWLAMGQNGVSSGSTIISRGYQMSGLFTIGTINTASDGYGVNFKYALSNVMPSFPYFPSTFDLSGTFIFDGSYVYNGLYGGTAIAPEIRLAISS